MNATIKEFLLRRLDEIIGNLKETNAHYALENELCDRLYEAIEPIIVHDKDLTICTADCANFSDYLEHQAAREVIIQETLYLQGYFDCIKILSALKVLPFS